MKRKSLTIRYEPNRTDYNQIEINEANSQKDKLIEYIYKNLIVRGEVTK